MTADTPTAPRPMFAKISAACAVLATVSPIVIGLLFVGAEQARPAPPESGPEPVAEAWGWLGRLIVTFALAVAAAGLSAAAGVVTGFVAVGRGERPSWPAWFGLCVCSPILLVLLAAVLSKQ